MRLKDFEPRRILVCQQRQIGDVLLATPALRLLKERYPEASLHLFTERKCAPLLRFNPHIDRLHLLDKHKMRTVSQLMAFYRRVAACDFDMVIDFQQLPRCQMIVGLSRAPVRLSFPAPWYRRPLYTHCVLPCQGYAAQVKVSLLEPLGIHWNGEKPEIFLQEAEKDQAEILLKNLGLLENHTLITLDPTHKRETKRWPIQNFARLVELLLADNPDFRFAVLRGPGEEAYIENLRYACSAAHVEHALLIPEKSQPIRMDAAIIEKAALHIGHCSAPRHIAVAVGTKTLIIPGASGPEWNYPSAEHVPVYAKIPCHPCHKLECTSLECLTSITPEMVELKARRVLAFEE